MSYPYIEHGGHRISLIYPFTIDDKLVTNLEIEEYATFRTVTYFRVQLNFNNWTGFQYNGSLDLLKREYNDYLRNIYEHYSWGRNTNNNTSIMRECLHYIRIYDSDYFTHLIEDAKEQCHEIQYNTARDITRYVAECRRQDRELDLGGRIGTYEPSAYVRFNEAAFEPTNYITRSDTNVFSNSNYAYYPIYGSSLVNTADRVVVTTADTSASRGTRASAVVVDDEGRTLSELWRSDMNNFYCGLDGYNNKRKIIHTYNYTPTYKKHYLDGEDEATTLLLGAEIEVDNGGETEEHAKEVLKIMNGEETWEAEENIYCVHDGSLKKGLEFPTQPGSLAWHKTLPYKKMFEYLDEHDYKAHDTETCGLHVHINRSFFGEQEAECIGKLMYILEKFNDEFSAIGRRNCRYAKMFGYNGEKCKELYQKGYSVKDKYNAINLLHIDTIEIRSFKGTLKYSTYINTLEFVEKLAYYVKDHTEEEIENMEWSDLYNTFSKKLKKYYDERAEIEKQKKKEEPLKKTGVGSFDAANVISSMNIASIRDITIGDRAGNVIARLDGVSNVNLTPASEEAVATTCTRTARSFVGTSLSGTLSYGTISGNTACNINVPQIEYITTAGSLRHALRNRPENHHVNIYKLNDDGSLAERVEYRYEESTNEVVFHERYRNCKMIAQYYTDLTNINATQVTINRDTVPTYATPYTTPMTSVTFETSIYSLESKEDKEKEIKNLKKKLKTEKNYLTKIKIQKDITKLQNELKKQINKEKKQSNNI